MSCGTPQLLLYLTKNAKLANNSLYTSIKGSTAVSLYTAVRVCVREKLPTPLSYIKNTNGGAKKGCMCLRRREREI